MTASATTPDIQRLAALLKDKRALVLSGAGISTESGIPDYRGPGSLKRPANPMRYQEFLGSEEARRRYWARSLLGWPRVQGARPNAGHQALARLERSGAITGVITQNVDGLHQAAGSRNVLELHGSLAVVGCLSCHRPESRRALQERMLELNPGFRLEPGDMAPDGDASIPQEAVEGFLVPGCLNCDGPLKPKVVFFGENVPKERVLRAYAMLESAGALVVVGSSLTVFSGYRFVKRAAQQGKPVAIVNQGPTRGDGEATLRVSGWLGEVLPALEGLL